MGTIYYMEGYIKDNFVKCNYTKSKDDAKILATLDKILATANELSEYCFGVYCDIKLLRESFAEKIRSK